MFKKEITYTNFNGEKVSEDFYFHLTKAETMELEASVKGGLSAWMNEIKDAPEDRPDLVLAAFKKLILASYGERSWDGKKFVKNQEIHDAFAATEAYSELIIGMFQDPEMGAEFFRNLVPTADSTGSVSSELVTSSQRARAASEAKMQGYRAPQPKKKEEEPTSFFEPAAEPEQVTNSTGTTLVDANEAEREALRRRLEELG